MPNKKQYQKRKQSKIDYFINTLSINGTDAELLYSITRESGHNATKPIIDYRLKRFASRRHKKFNHIKELYRKFLEHSAQEMQKPIITALLIRKSNKNNLIMQECELIDTIESYKSLLNIDTEIEKTEGRINDIKINLYFNKASQKRNLNDADNIVIMERYGNIYRNRAIITKRNPKSAENESLEYNDITIILYAKKSQIINNKIEDILLIN